ncbi:hypothetical protein M433DRAFT_163470 [Acidomyces richmondensis BFW]|nr:hypothetical protein M433DRAFT_163470 [Acidomyces richmondensis BFW]
MFHLICFLLALLRGSIRYAALPLGSLRFAAPENPMVTADVQGAFEHGPIFLPTPGSGTNFTAESENCLVLDVYALTQAASRGKMLPVYFFVQGGGFISNINPDYNGSGLIIAGGYEIVVVNFNYRVGPYGGFKKYIHHFGGDPGHVTIGGDSAGAQVVDSQVTAYGGRDDGLFYASAAESHQILAHDLNALLDTYDNLVIRTGCSSSDDTLACLRSLNVSFLQYNNVNTPFPNAMYPPLFPYGPVLDHDFIEDYTYAAYVAGRFVKTSSLGNAGTFIRDQWPLITHAQLHIWNKFYNSDAFPNFGKNASELASRGAYYQAAAVGYGEMTYMPVPNWNYRWNVQDPTADAEGLGVTHTIEINAIWGPENTNGGAPSSYYPGEVTYWTSFIRSHNLKTFRLQGTPEWQIWTVEHSYQRMIFETNNTHTEAVPAAQKEKGDWAASIALSLEQ